MGLSAKKKLALAAIESTYGTDAAPGSADAVLTHNLDITPLEADYVARELDRHNFGGEEEIPVGVHVTASFEVELAGAGSKATPPGYGPLLRACGLAETVVDSDSDGTDDQVEYSPVSTGFESVTLYTYWAGNLHAIVGARGTFSLSFSPQGIPRLSFNFTGLWQDPSATTPPAPDFSAFQQPLAVSDANDTFSLHGQSPVMRELSVDLGMEVNYQNVVGQENVAITDRAVTGSCNIDAPLISTYDWFATAKNAQLGALSHVHGTTAGNIVEVAAPNVQVKSPSYGEDNGIRTLEMDLALVPTDAGDDEFKLITR